MNIDITDENTLTIFALHFFLDFSLFNDFQSTEK